ncbi:MAG: hypothetical protein EOM20_09585 [Spartobacteria bacterium]|nr:hypothetical protein [Spartobacteria bacterium]
MKTRLQTSASGGVSVLPEKRFLIKFLMALFAFFLPLLVAEVGLRALSFDYGAPPVFYYPTSNSILNGIYRVNVPYETFRPYYWLTVPDTEISNSRGFAGEREYEDEKPEGTIRVAVMGCSCTQGSGDAYPAKLERLLAEALGSNRYEVINGGVGSYSTWQGLQMFEQRILPLKPDIVTVFYGWNDRWVHDGMRDSKHVFPLAWTFAACQRLLEHSELFKALLYLKARWIRAHIEQRVPPDEYEENLRMFVSRCRKRGIRVILCTTPDGLSRRMVENRFDVSTNLADPWSRDLYALYKDQADSPYDVWRHIHDLYNGAVRRVAEEEGVALLDLDVLFNARQAASLKNGLPFYVDGVHFSAYGEQEMAVLFAETLASPPEHEALSNYLYSTAYYLTNAWGLARQFAYRAADHCMRLAEARPDYRPAPNWRWLRGQIDAELPVYRLVNEARFMAAYAGDPLQVAGMLMECLSLRPSDQVLRMYVAEQLFDMQFYLESLRVLTTAPGPYEERHQNRVLWMAFDAAFHAGLAEDARHYLSTLRQYYPDDVWAARMEEQIREAGMPFQGRQ